MAINARPNRMIQQRLESWRDQLINDATKTTGAPAKPSRKKRQLRRRRDNNETTVEIAIAPPSTIHTTIRARLRLTGGRLAVDATHANKLEGRMGASVKTSGARAKPSQTTYAPPLPAVGSGQYTMRNGAGAA